MHPYLFDWVINGHHLRPPSYGVMLALAFSAAYFVSLYRANKLDEDIKHIENLFIVVIVCAVVGMRMFHVVFEDLGYYLEHPVKVFAVWEGGYTFYGGVLFTVFGSYLYCRWKKIDYLQFTDIMAPATMLGLAVGRVGCFLAGCCWGRPSDLPWAVKFTHPDSFCSVKGVPLHPTQVYESLGALLIFGYLTWRFNRRQYRGQIFFHCIFFYGILRFLIEYFRGDEIRGYVFGGLLSYSQLIALFMLPFAVTGMFVFSRKEE